MSVTELPPSGGRPDLSGGSASAWVEDWEQTSLREVLREVLWEVPRLRTRIAQRMEMSSTEVAVVERLMEAGPVGPVGLARWLGVTPAAASMAVDRLEGRGHVRREADPADGRRTRVVVTPSGREDTFGELLPMFQGLERAMQDLGGNEAVIVERFLRQVLAALREETVRRERGSAGGSD